MNIHIGCSSFRERSWKGVFYPDELPQSRYFSFYCDHFDTYEMNGTFYKFPTPKQMEKWYRESPSGFLFSVKVPRVITHFRKMEDCARELADFYRAVEPLGEKLGAVLFQFPGSYPYTQERLSLLLASVPADHRTAFEFRHESWWRDDVVEALQKSGIAFSGVSFPRLNDGVMTTSPTLYYRFHGNRSLFKSSYTDEELRTFADAVKSKRPQTAFIYFNNTATSAGVENALKLNAILTEN